jgi:mannose-1-phosphate guanylyltransferase
MTPDRFEEGYGWIEPAGPARCGRSRPVASFREKPSIVEAQRLMAQGALWNTFVFAARGATLWEMARLTIRDVCDEFEAMKSMLPSAHAGRHIEHAYTGMRTVNFSLEVLTPMTSRLRVLAVPEVGWSDWGSVARILASAKEIGRLHEIAARLSHSQISDPSTKTIVARFLRAQGGLYGSPKSQHARPVPIEIRTDASPR